MKELERLIAIRNLSQKDPKWIHRDIFRILRKDDIWIAAYKKLKKNKSELTLGSATETIDRMSLEQLKRLKDKVCDETYKFKPVKLTYIPQPDGKSRPLDLPTNKIVEKVMRMILDAIYEPVFIKVSFGFKTGLGCHDALDYVERKFRWIDYVIEKNIEQKYCTINHNILIKILEKRIVDPRFIRLIWKLLGCGIFFVEQIEWYKMGVLQGNIVFPILANIYYHEFDEFILDLKKQLETLRPERKYLKNSAYKVLIYKINKIYKEMIQFEPQSLKCQKRTKHLKSLRRERLQTKALKNQAIRIKYVRYADDWIVGVSGAKTFSLHLKSQIVNFMKNTLLQQIHSEKINVINFRTGNVHFLAYKIFLPRNRPISEYKKKGVKIIRRRQPHLGFDIPVTKVTKQLEKLGYLKQLKNELRPVSKASYAVLEDHVIVNHYRNVWLGLLNYYSGCTYRGRLQYIHYLLHMSCAMTLGHRHRKSCSAIFRKHGKKLTITLDTGKTVLFPYKTSWKLSKRKWLRGKYICLPTNHYANSVAR